MALEGIVKDLWDEVDRITKPRFDAELVKDKIKAASDLINKSYTRGAAEGPAIVDKVEEFAALYLSAAGTNLGDVKDKSAKEQYAHEMKNILGDNYLAFRDAIRTDDIDTALSLAKNAFTGNSYLATVQSTVERVQLLSPDEQMKWATQAAKSIGGNNPLAVLQNIGGYISTLRQIKGLRQPYITAAPAHP